MGMERHGMTPKEAMIMDLWDAGLSKADIVAQTGFTEKRTSQIISQLDGGDGGFEKMVIRGSRLLFEAVKAHHGRFIRLLQPKRCARSVCKLPDVKTGAAIIVAFQ